MKFVLIALMLFGCGSNPTEDEFVDNRTPEPPGTGGTEPEPKPPHKDWDGVLSIIKEQCALSGCHAGAKFLATGRAFKASGSAQLIRNDRMPKPQSPNYDLWTDKKKSDLLGYLGG